MMLTATHKIILKKAFNFTKLWVLMYFKILKLNDVNLVNFLSNSIIFARISDSLMLKSILKIIKKKLSPNYESSSNIQLLLYQFSKFSI